jgi:hypothetical protein
MILIWVNLTGHLSWSIVDWLFQHGVMPFYTPLSGSWLNLAEALSVHRLQLALEWLQPPCACQDKSRPFDAAKHGHGSRGRPHGPSLHPRERNGPAVRQRAVDTVRQGD